MKIVLGLYLDGKRSLKKCNAFNRLVLGPSGFLSQLELYLGLTARHPAKLLRVIQFRKALRRLDNGKRFYSRSMKIDDFGVAAELLEWRDELYLHGWNGSFLNKPVPDRLRDLAEVETLLRREHFSPGNGERLVAVADALQRLQVPISFIELLEPLERHPLRWQQVIALFPYSFCKSFLKPAAPEGSQLHALQRCLLSPGPSCRAETIEPDNSLGAVTADNPLTAAYHVSGELHLERNDVLLVNGGEQRALDQVLEAQGYPRQSLQVRERSLPSLQLLPLLLRLRRKPLDVEALLAFLTLPEPLNPVDPALSERLASVVASFPGTGGRLWQAVLRDFPAEEGKHTESAVTELHRWIGGKKTGYNEPMPLGELKTCAVMVREFFSRKKEESEQKEALRLYSSGYDQASAFTEAVTALIGEGEVELGRYQVDQLLTQAASGVTRMPEREAGSVPDTPHPGAVGEPFDQVIWWWAAAPTMEQGTAWLKNERLFLEREGALFPSQEEMLAWQDADWLRPVLAAKKSCLLVLPPEGEERHPLWQKIASIVPSLAIEQIESRFSKPERGRKTPVAVRDLPGKKALWRLSPGRALPDTVFSPTSLETFITAPSCWFLEHVAGITSSKRLEPSRGPLLFGNLAHRLLEQLVARIQPGSEQSIDHKNWFTNAFNSLLRTEGAILLMPGRSAEMENLRFLLHRALEQLNPVLQAVGSNGIRAEYALDGSLSGNRLRGRADLLLYDRNNQPSVVDMKWGRAEERRKNLQQGLHIQLLAYASMVHEKTGQWPSLAYFIVKNARLLVAPSAATLPGEVVRHEDDESPGSLWQRVINSFDWRMAQLQAGFFSVADTGDTGNPMLIPPVEGLPLAPGDNPYNPYRFLEGWEGNE